MASTAATWAQLGDAATLAARARPVLTQRQASPASTESAPAAGLSAGDSGAAPPVTPKVVGTRPCEMEVRAARPGLGTVVYFATGQVAGVPVVVLGFAAGTAAGRRHPSGAGSAGGVSGRSRSGRALMTAAAAPTATASHPLNPDDRQPVVGGDPRRPQHPADGEDGPRRGQDTTSAGGRRLS